MFLGNFSVTLYFQYADSVFYFQKYQQCKCNCFSFLERPDLIPCLKDLTISCLKDSKNFLLDELEPNPISDLLFEKGAIEIFTHDKLTETVYRRQRAKFLIETVQENRNDCFQFFLFILQKKYSYICEELQKSKVLGIKSLWERVL